jgi:hypothetical protein
MRDEPEHSRALARRILEEHRSFGVQLVDGSRWRCRLLAYGDRELLVETNQGRYLLPWRSVLYLELDAIAEEVPVLATVAELPLELPKEEDCAEAAAS